MLARNHEQQQSSLRSEMQAMHTNNQQTLDDAVRLAAEKHTNAFNDLFARQ
jgi:hypothetical protein